MIGACVGAGAERPGSVVKETGFGKTTGIVVVRPILSTIQVVPAVVVIHCAAWGKWKGEFFGNLVCYVKLCVQKYVKTEFVEYS